MIAPAIAALQRECVRTTSHSAGSSLPGLRRICSGSTSLPMSCKYEAWVKASKDSGGSRIAMPSDSVKRTNRAVCPCGSKPRASSSTPKFGKALVEKWILPSSALVDTGFFI